MFSYQVSALRCDEVVQWTSPRRHHHFQKQPKLLMLHVHKHLLFPKTDDKYEVICWISAWPVVWWSVCFYMPIKMTVFWNPNRLNSYDRSAKKRYAVWCIFIIRPQKSYFTNHDEFPAYSCGMTHGHNDIMTESKLKQWHVVDNRTFKSMIHTSILLTFLMPRPPPPYAALKMTGVPYCSQNAYASSADLTGPGVPGTTCTPKYKNTLTSLCTQKSVKHFKKSLQQPFINIKGSDNNFTMFFQT